MKSLKLKPLAEAVGRMTDDVVISGVGSTLGQKIEEPVGVFDEGFLPVMDNIGDTAWMALSCFRAFVHDKLAMALVDKGSDVRMLGDDSSIIGEDEWGSTITQLGQTGGHYSRVKKVKGGWKLSLNIDRNLTLSLPHLFSRATYDALHWKDAETRAVIHNRGIEALKKEFGAKLFDAEGAFDKTIPAGDLIKDWPTLDLTKLDIDADLFKQILNTVKAFRIVSPPIEQRKHSGFYNPEVPATYVTDREGNLVLDKDNFPIIKTPKKDRELVNKLEDATDKVGFCVWVMENRHFNIFLDMVIPEDVASYITQTPPERIRPSYISQWIVQWCLGGIIGTQTPVYRILPITEISKENAVHPQKHLVKARTNADGLAISSDGSLTFIPTLDNTEQYDNDIEHYGDREEGEFALEDCKNPEATRYDTETYVNDAGEEKETKYTKKLPANRVIYSDWINNKLAYTDTSGVPRVLDLEGYMPANHNIIWRLLNGSMAKYGNANQALNNLLGFAFRQAKEHGFNVEEEFEKEYTKEGLFSEPDYEVLHRRAKGYAADGFANFIGQVWYGLNTIASRAARDKRYRDDYGSDTPQSEAERMMEKYPWLEEYCARQEDFTYSLLDENSPIAVLRPYGKAIKFIGELIEKDLNSYISHRSVINTMQEIAVIKGLANYMGKADKVKEADLAERDVYLNPQLEENYVPKNVPMVKEIGMQPHQLKVFNYLKNSPPCAILDVSAGGGKTIIVLSDILFELGQKHVRKPLILCPAHLVKDYIKEANFVTKGRLNVIAVTTGTMRSWGEDRLKALIDNAPVNTVIVSDYDFVKGKVEGTSYGNLWINIGRNAEFLRQFSFDGVWMDESHYLKNASTQRNASVQRLVTEIPMRRLATGTFVTDVLTDVVGQFNLVDPSVFGDIDHFKEQFGDEMRGNKVVSWKPGAEAEVARRMREHSNMVTVRRKEWASLLPERKEAFYPAELTEAQRAVYEAILNEVIEEIKARKPELIEKLNSEDESLAEELERQLNPYLARLERFIAAPMVDPAAQLALRDPEDQRSPKGRIVNSIIEEHLKEGIPGKILVFTSYIGTAETIYNELPPELKSQAILYTAARKMDCREEFENNKKKKIMIGVEASMNTGLNLQVASRLIRVETVWNPGTLDQGESRINRPQLKAKETRTAIYFDWIIANKTIDVTKTARLIGKLISKAKFDEQTDSRFQNLPDLPLVSMSLDNIKEMKDYENELSRHFSVFQAWKQLEEKTFQEFKEQSKFKEPIVPLPDGELLPGAKLLKNIPYVPDMDIYGSDELGLVKFKEFLRRDVSEEDEGTEKERDEYDPTGLSIHTELGDGVCVSCRRNKQGQITSLRVRLPDGSAQNFGILECFVITKKTTSTKSIKQRLFDLVGLAPKTEKPGKPKQKEPELQPPPSPKTPKVKTEPEEEPKKPIKTVKPAKPEGKPEAKPPKEEKKPKVLKPVPTTDFEDDDMVELWLTVINNMIGVAVDMKDPDADPATFKQFGFRACGAYMYTRIPRAKTLRLLIDALKAKYVIKPQYLKVLETMYVHFNQGKSKLLNVQQASTADIQNFYRTKFKAAAPKELKPYPIIQDGELYICCDIASQPATKTLKSKVIVPGVKWIVDDPILFYFAKSKQDAKEKILEVNRHIKVENLAEIKQEYNQIKLFKSGKK